MMRPGSFSIAPPTGGQVAPAKVGARHLSVGSRYGRSHEIHPAPANPPPNPATIIRLADFDLKHSAKSREIITDDLKAAICSSEESAKTVGSNIT